MLCNIRPYTTRSNRWNGEIHQNLSLVLIQQEQLWLKQISIKCGTNETESRKKLTDAHGIHLSPVLCWASGVKDCRPWCCSPEFELLFHSKQRWIIFLGTGNHIDLHLGEDFVRVLPTMRWMWFHQLLFFWNRQSYGLPLISSLFWKIYNRQIYFFHVRKSRESMNIFGIIALHLKRTGKHRGSIVPTLVNKSAIPEALVTFPMWLVMQMPWGFMDHCNCDHEDCQNKLQHIVDRESDDC